MIGISKAAGLSYGDCIVVVSHLVQQPGSREEPEAVSRLWLEYEKPRVRTQYVRTEGGPSPGKPNHTVQERITMNASNQEIITASEVDQEDVCCIPGLKKSQLDIVDRWILRQIRPSNRFLPDGDYWLPHYFWDDTGITLTSEAFSHAMTLAGYPPCEGRDHIRRYRVSLYRRDKPNLSPFVRWAGLFRTEDSSRGRFVCTMAEDHDFPVIAYYPMLRRYLELKRNLPDRRETLETFEKLWKEFTNTIGGTDAPLLSRFSYDDLTAINEWLQDDVRPTGKFDLQASCNALYTLQRRVIFKKVTRDEYGQLMHLAGYDCENTNADALSFRLNLVRDMQSNNNPFLTWIRRFKGEKSRRGEVVSSLISDKEAPVLADHDLLHCFLMSNGYGYLTDYEEIFEELWSLYEKETRKD